MTTQTVKTPTLQEFKKFALDIAPAARAVLIARVHAQMERERVDAYIRPIFETYRFTATPDNIAHGAPEVIPDPDHLFMADLDDPLVAAFYEDCDRAHRAHGFTGPHGHCPALVADTLRRTTERLLIDLAEPLFGIESDQLFGEKRDKYLELLISAALGAEKESR